MVKGGGERIEGKVEVEVKVGLAFSDPLAGTRFDRIHFKPLTPTPYSTVLAKIKQKLKASENTKNT